MAFVVIACLLAICKFANEVAQADDAHEATLGINDGHTPQVLGDEYRTY